MGKPFPGRIPWLAVIAWSQFHDYTRDQIEMLDHCIGAMDTVFQAQQKEGGS